LIEDTTKLFALVFKEKNIEMVLDITDQEINSDYEQLQSVLSNFISNAINHIDYDRTIEISAKTSDNDSVIVSVINAGENIPENEINNIWDSFYKVDKARTRAYGGQGLGLSIVKTILETLGYDYGIKNLDKRVEFFFIIDSLEF
jgi:signal transduction histidine kinase